MRIKRGKYKPLGLVASHQRNIGDGAAYEKYFADKPATGTTKTIHNNADVYQTLEMMEKIAKKTSDQTIAITGKLFAADERTFLKNIFDFLYNNIQYKNDTPGFEDLRQPIRSWKDRKTGIDCDCFSIFISSILHNAGVDHSFRVIKIKGNDAFHHVYVVVPKFAGANMDKENHASNYWVIDPVLDEFDKEAEPIIELFDKPMNGLSGSLNGLGEALTPPVIDYVAAKQELIALRTLLISGQSAILNDHTDKQSLLSALDYLLQYWDIPGQRERAIAIIRSQRDNLLKPASLKQLKGLGDVDYVDAGKGALQYGSTGATAGAALGPIGSIVGGTAGALIGAALSFSKSDANAASNCDRTKMITGFWDFTKGIPVVVTVNECDFYQQLAPNNIKLFGSVDAYSVALNGMYRFVNDYPNWQSVVQQILAFQQAHYGVALFGPFLTMYSTDPAQARGLIAQYLGIQSKYSGNTPAPSAAPVQPGTQTQSGNTSNNPNPAQPGNNNNGTAPTPYTPNQKTGVQTAGMGGVGTVFTVLLLGGIAYTAIKAGVFNSKKAAA